MSTGTTTGTTTATTTGTTTRTGAVTDDERLRRWRLVLGGGEADGTGRALTGTDAAMDGALTALYGRTSQGGDRTGRDRSAGLGASAPSVARWLGDIRTYFPSSVVQVMQRDAIDRLGLATLLLEPEMLEAVEADVHLVGTLLSLHKAMPETTRETARAVVRKVVDDLEKRLATRPRDPHRRPRPLRPHQPPPPPGHRLGPDHPRQPQELSARAPHGRPRAADRPRAGLAGDTEGGRALRRPVRLHGRLHRPRLRLRRRTRLHAVDRHPARRLRHRRRGPDRPARRPRRRPLRHPARRRHRHQPRPRPLPVEDHPPRRHRGRPHQRSVRGRHPRRDAEAGRR